MARRKGKSKSEVKATRSDSVLGLQSNSTTDNLEKDLGDLDDQAIELEAANRNGNSVDLNDKSEVKPPCYTSEEAQKLCEIVYTMLTKNRTFKDNSQPSVAQTQINQPVTIQLNVVNNTNNIKVDSNSGNINISNVGNVVGSGSGNFKNITTAATLSADEIDLIKKRWPVIRFVFTCNFRLLIQHRMLSVQEMQIKFNIDSEPSVKESLPENRWRSLLPCMDYLMLQELSDKISSLHGLEQAQKQSMESSQIFDDISSLVRLWQSEQKYHLKLKEYLERRLWTHLSCCDETKPYILFVGEDMARRAVGIPSVKQRLADYGLSQKVRTVNLNSPRGLESTIDINHARLDFHSIGRFNEDLLCLSDRFEYFKICAKSNHGKWKEEYNLMCHSVDAYEVRQLLNKFKDRLFPSSAFSFDDEKVLNLMATAFGLVFGGGQADIQDEEQLLRNYIIHDLLV